MLWLAWGGGGGCWARSYIKSPQCSMGVFTDFPLLFRLWDGGKGWGFEKRQLTKRRTMLLHVCSCKLKKKKKTLQEWITKEADLNLQPLEAETTTYEKASCAWIQQGVRFVYLHVPSVFGHCALPARIHFTFGLYILEILAEPQSKTHTQKPPFFFCLPVLW